MKPIHPKPRPAYIGLSLPRSPLEQKALLEGVLEALTEANARWFRQHPKAPCCLSCSKKSLRYVPTPPGQDQSIVPLRLAPDLLAGWPAHWADPATYAAGHARAQGKEARVVLEPAGPTHYRAVVYVDGQRKDPCKALRLAAQPST